VKKQLNNEQVEDLLCDMIQNSNSSSIQYTTIQLIHQHKIHKSSDKIAQLLEQALPKQIWDYFNQEQSVTTGGKKSSFSALIENSKTVGYDMMHANVEAIAIGSAFLSTLYLISRWATNAIPVSLVRMNTIWELFTYDNCCVLCFLAIQMDSCRSMGTIQSCGYKCDKKYL